MFDTITGLPVHALVVHLAVIGIPVMAVLTVAAAFRPSWRARAWMIVIGDGLMVACALAARQSGKNLQARLSGVTGTVIASTHGHEGTWMWAFALALTLAAATVWAAARWVGLIPLAAGLAIVTGVGAIAWTVAVGDSGARAVWEQTIKNTHAP